MVQPLRIFSVKYYSDLNIHEVDMTEFLEVEYDVIRIKKPRHDANAEFIIATAQNKNNLESNLQRFGQTFNQNYEFSIEDTIEEITYEYEDEYDRATWSRIQEYVNGWIGNNTFNNSHQSSDDSDSNDSYDSELNSSPDENSSIWVYMGIARISPIENRDVFLGYYPPENAVWTGNKTDWLTREWVKEKSLECSEWLFYRWIHDITKIGGDKIEYFYAFQNRFNRKYLTANKELSYVSLEGWSKRYSIWLSLHNKEEAFLLWNEPTNKNLTRAENDGPPILGKGNGYWIIENSQSNNTSQPKDEL
jgi:hypothetical protein